MASPLFFIAPMLIDRLLDRIATPRNEQKPRAQLKEELLEELKKSPEYQHATSAEAWYQSRANWSAIISVLTPIAAIGGYTLSSTSAECLALAGEAAGPVFAAITASVGGLWAAFLARRARTATRPLGG